MCARDVTDVTRAEALMGTLAQTFARGTALLDANALLDATEPTFEALRWKVAFVELVPGGSITRRVLAAPLGDPLGDYGRSLVGIHMPFDKTPVLTEAVKKGTPIFLDNLPTTLPGPISRAVELSASMERAQVIRSAWCPILTNGQLSHVLVVTGRDLTEHDFVAVQLFAAQLGAAINLSALRAALVQKERLAAVGQMAAVMAHEVRNPLGIIFNALSGLRRVYHASDLAPELIDIIQEESDRLRRLITDLLDFSRPLAVQVQSVEAEPLLRDAAEAACLDTTNGAGKRKVDIDVPAGLPEIETDPMLLRRALVNLIVNALQNVSADGRVSLTARPSDGELYVSVANDAVPMAPEVAARVFEPFFTTRAAGTGLGLAVVRRIVEDLGGSVALEGPSETSGTTFSIRLPLRAVGINR
jgi:signal transduction histidine kinase